MITNIRRALRQVALDCRGDVEGLLGLIAVVVGCWAAVELTSRIAMAIAGGEW